MTSNKQNFIFTDRRKETQHIEHTPSITSNGTYLITVHNNDGKLSVHKTPFMKPLFTHFAFQPILVANHVCQQQPHNPDVRLNKKNSSIRTK